MIYVLPPHVYIYIWECGAARWPYMSEPWGGMYVANGPGPHSSYISRVQIIGLPNWVVWCLPALVYMCLPALVYM